MAKPDWVKSFDDMINKLLIEPADHLISGGIAKIAGGAESLQKGLGEIVSSALATVGFGFGGSECKASDIAPPKQENTVAANKTPANDYEFHPSNLGNLSPQFGNMAVVRSGQGASMFQS